MRHQRSHRNARKITAQIRPKSSATCSSRLTVQYSLARIQKWDSSMGFRNIPPPSRVTLTDRHGLPAATTTDVGERSPAPVKGQACSGSRDSKPSRSLPSRGRETGRPPPMAIEFLRSVRTASRTLANEPLQRVGHAEAAGATALDIHEEHVRASACLPRGNARTDQVGRVRPRGGNEPLRRAHPRSASGGMPISSGRQRSSGRTLARWNDTGRESTRFQSLAIRRGSRIHCRCTCVAPLGTGRRNRPARSETPSKRVRTGLPPGNVRGELQVAACPGPGVRVLPAKASAPQSREGTDVVKPEPDQPGEPILRRNHDTAAAVVLPRPGTTRVSSTAVTGLYTDQQYAFAALPTSPN